MSEITLEVLYESFATQGDVDALAQVFDRAAPALARLARQLTSDSAAADDLVQETFLFAVEQPQTFDPGRKLMPWLVGILVNRARTARQQQARTPDATRLHDREVPTPHALASRAEHQAAVSSAVASLPGDLREVVEARLAGVQTNELADRLGVARGTMRVRLHRGLQRLRSALPPGLATAFAVTFLHTKAQAATRTLILEAARQHPLAPATAAATTATGLGSYLAVKKALAATAVTLLSLTALQWSGALSPRPDGEAQLALNLATQPLALAISPEEESSLPDRSVAQVATEPRQEVVSSPATQSGPGISPWPDGGEELVLILGDTRAPAAGAIVRHVVAAEPSPELRLTDFVLGLVQGHEVAVSDLGLSTHYQADEFGRVRVPRASGPALVIANLGGKVGYLPRGSHLLGGDRMVLAAPMPLVVRVRDGAGRAVPGYPISSSPSLAIRRSVPSCTDNQGEYRLEHFNTLVVPLGLTREGVAPKKLTVTAGVGGVGPSRTLGAALAVRKPIELVVPGGGTVHVKVAVKGEQPHLDAPMEIELKGAGILAGRMMRIERNEVAIFGGLPAGSAVTASMNLEGAFNAIHQVVGEAGLAHGVVPGREQETVPLTVVLDQSLGEFISGRMLGPDGELVRSASCTLITNTITGDRRSATTTTFQTDGRGNFAAPLRGVPGTWDPDVSQVQFEFRAQVGDTPALVGRSNLLSAGLGWPLALGDVTMVAPSVLVAGRVVDDIGRPVVDAKVSVLSWDAVRSRMDSFGRPTRLVPVTGVTTTPTGADGRFQVIGITESSDLFLEVKLRSQLAGQARSFTRGQLGLELEVERRGAISGSIELPMGQAAALWSVRVCNQDRAYRGGPPINASRGVVTQWGSRGADTTPDQWGEFAWTDLRPGKYVVTLSLVGQREPVSVWKDVIVLPGQECLDPRLQEITGSGLLNFMGVTIADQAGQPIPHSGLVLVGARGEGIHAEMIPTGTGSVAYLRQPSKVIVAAPGFQAARVPFTPGHLRIELAPSFEVSLVLPVGLVLGDNQSLQVALRPTAGPESILPVQISRPVDLIGGAASYPVVTLGTHRYEVWLETDQGTGTSSRTLRMGNTTLELGSDSAGTHFEIPVTQEMLDRE